MKDFVNIFRNSEMSDDCCVALQMTTVHLLKE